MAQWLRLRASTAGGCGSIPGWGLRFHMPFGSTESILRKEPSPADPLGGRMSLSSPRRPGSGGQEFQGRWSLLSGCPRSLGPLNQVLVSGGWQGRGAQSSPPQSAGSAPDQPVSSPPGFAAPPVGQMSHAGRCPALWALSAHGSTREAAGAVRAGFLSEPGFCQGFFVHKWQKPLSLA